MPLIPPNQDRDDVIRAVAKLLDCSYLDEVPTTAESDRLREVAVTAREALDRIVARALAAEADADRWRKVAPLIANLHRAALIGASHTELIAAVAEVTAATQEPTP